MTGKHGREKLPLKIMKDSLKNKGHQLPVILRGRRELRKQQRRDLENAVSQAELWISQKKRNDGREG